MNPALLPAVALAAVLLAACSTPHGPDHAHAMADACATHLQAGTPEARRAAAEAHVAQMHGSATPEHVERHLKMMDARCGAPGGTAPR